MQVSKKKYGKSLWEETDEILKQNKLRWMEAQQLITSGDNWDQALMRCHTIFEEILELAVMNDLIDYDVFDESITSRLFGGAMQQRRVSKSLRNIHKGDEIFWQAITHDDGVEARGGITENSRVKWDLVNQPCSFRLLNRYLMPRPAWTGVPLPLPGS